MRDARIPQAQAIAAAPITGFDDVQTQKTERRPIFHDGNRPNEFIVEQSC